MGSWGWVGLGLAIISWELVAPETLTHAFQRGYEHPIGKFLLIGALGTTALHLTGVIPPELDIYYGFGVIEPYES